MRRTPRRALGWLRVAGICLTIAAFVGCQASTPLEEAGLGLTPPSGWTSADPSALTVPGAALAAWRGPEGSSLVAYRTLPGPGASARAMGQELANRLTNLPGVHDVAHRVETIAGREAARVEAVAPGTGEAFAPSGTGEAIAPAGKTLVETHRVCVGWPDPGGNIWICGHFPESARAKVAPQIEDILKTVRLEGRSRGTQSY